MCDVFIWRMFVRICYVRYLYQEDVHEDLLCAISLSGMCVRICYV